MAAVEHFGDPSLIRVVAGIAIGTQGRQTVPRAELTAVCVVLELSRKDYITIIIDATYILRGVARGPAQGRLSASADLWNRFWKAVRHYGTL